MDYEKDWYANIIKIRNKRRRQKDALYQEKQDETAS
jgi:hypothetical protein